MTDMGLFYDAPAALQKVQFTFHSLINSALRFSFKHRRQTLENQGLHRRVNNLIEKHISYSQLQAIGRKMDIYCAHFF